MTWINLISEDLTRMRLYASAALACPSEGDLAVEAALGDLFESCLSLPPGRISLFRLLDRQLRSLPGARADERIELLKHVCGFTPSDAEAIVKPDSAAPLRSAG